MVACFKSFYLKGVNEGDSEAIVDYVYEFLKEAKTKTKEEGPFYRYACTKIPLHERHRFVASIGFGYNDT
jgi:hypothetical protein